MCFIILCTQPDGTLFFLIFTYLRGRSHWISRDYASNVAICHFLKPETNKGDFRLYFELLWKWQKEKISITCPRVCQTKDLCRKMYKKGNFSPAIIEKSSLFYVPMNHLTFWKGRLEAPTFFAIKTPRQAVWVPYDSRQLSKIPLSASLWGEVVKATIKLAYLYRPLSISTVSIWNDGKITPSTNKHGQVNAIIIWININWNWNYGVKYRS